MSDKEFKELKEALKLEYPDSYPEQAQELVDMEPDLTPAQRNALYDYLAYGI